MITKKQYVEYLVSTPTKCTCTYLAEPLEDVSHDVVNAFLHDNRFLPREGGKLLKARLQDSKEACLRVEESVQDNRYSRFSDLLRAQYSRTAPRVVKGLGVVRVVPRRGQAEDFYPRDSRVSAPDVAGKTKHQHCRERLVHALDPKPMQARPLLVAGWDASADNLKGIPRRKRTFFPTRKSTRWGSLSQEEGDGQREAGEGTPTRLPAGGLVQLQEGPFPGRLFKLVAPDGDLDWGLTKDLEEPLTAQVAKDSRAVRWQVEELPRGLKQLTGPEKGQWRVARAQRKHLAGCYHAWGS